MVELLPEITQALKLTPAERAARGKAARKKAPRSAHARWEAPAGRPDPVGLLEEQAADRVPDLVPIRYGRMLVSPGTFYRGGALLMASDLAGTPDSGLTAQLCGDAHLMNFGLFQSPERRLVFDINDFDETLPGPWEWDVKRLAASFEVAARDRGYPRRRDGPSSCTASAPIARPCSRWPRQGAIESGTRGSTPTDPGSTSASLGGKDARRMARRHVRARETKDDLRALSRLTAEVGWQAAAPERPAPARPGQGAAGGRGAGALHERRGGGAAQLPREPAARTASTSTTTTSSVRSRARSSAWAASARGPGSCCSSAGIDGDPLFLQAKQAQASVLERFVGRSRYRNSGRRVVEGQRLMQAAATSSWAGTSVIGFDGKPYDFYVRQLWDGKGAFNVEAMTEARGHLRRDVRLDARPGARALRRPHRHRGVPGHGRRFDRAVADFADAYAEQNQRTTTRCEKPWTPAESPRRPASRRDRGGGPGRRGGAGRRGPGHPSAFATGVSPGNHGASDAGRGGRRARASRRMRKGMPDGARGV